MLNISGESGYPCLVPELSYNAFSFSPLRIIFAEAYHIWPTVSIILNGEKLKAFPLRSEIR